MKKNVKSGKHVTRKISNILSIYPRLRLLRLTIMGILWEAILGYLHYLIANRALWIDKSVCKLMLNNIQ